MNKFRNIIIALLCLAGALTSAYLSRQEISVLLQPQRTSADFYSFMARGGDKIAPSSYSKKVDLLDCDFTLHNLVKAPAQNRRDILKACESFSSTVVASMPTDSYAWYVNALANAKLVNTDKFRTSYHQSRLTGPNEQWIVEARANLAEDMLHLLDAQAVADHEADLTLLANSAKGTKTIARRYALDENFRERIVRIVSSLPPDRQRAFLSNVRRAVTENTRS